MDGKELASIIAKAQKDYYNGTPTLSDAEYDLLLEELRRLDLQNPLLKLVGAKPEVDSRLQKVTHQIAMGSLCKVNEKEDFIKWANATNSTRFLLQPKFDGISASVQYVKGKFTQAVSRGSGTEGEDITHNIRNCVPETIPQDFTGFLRGEVLIKKSIFSKYLSNDFANARNAASGIARRLDGDLSQYLSIIFFDVESEDVGFGNWEAKVSYIRKLLHLETGETVLCSVENCVKWYDHYDKKLRKELDYEIDGLVIKINNLELHDSLGETDNRPNGQIAWKFPPEMGISTVKSIQWQVGKIGHITPVAYIEPVTICGVSISQVSLHNFGNMQNLNIGVNAKVLISRRNDVIPYAEKCLDAGSPPEYPTYCPICMDQTRFEGEFLTCPNPGCKGKTIGNLQKWIEVQEIEECGESFIEDVMGLCVKDVADLYELKWENLLQLPGYKKTKATKIVEEINKKKTIKLVKFMAGLNIPNLGQGTWDSLYKNGYDTLDKILSISSQNDLLKLSGIGPTTAQAIMHAISDRKILNIIMKLQKHITIEQKVVGKLTGKSFCFTGEIGIKRNDAMRLVEQAGGEVKTSVSKGLTYLVQADPNSNSTKAQKARKYGTRVIGETEFLKLVDFSFKKLL